MITAYFSQLNRNIPEPLPQQTIKPRAINYDYIIYMLVIFLMIATPAFAKITLQLDKPKVGMGETFTLTVSSDQPQNNTQPDLSAIESAFDVVGSEHQISYNLMNGVTTASNQWNFVLLPKKTGTFRFPPLTVGSEKTVEGFGIEVTPDGVNPTVETHTNTTEIKDLFIETRAVPNQSYINQQIIYSVKVYNRQRLMNVEYTPPHVDNALMIQLDDAQHDQVTLHGQLYAVEELRYAIFPNKSGPLEIHPPLLKGLIYEMVPHPIQAKGQLLRLTILPAPVQQIPFLPAESLQLSETIEPAAAPIKQGETLIRTITLSADGIPASNLPILSFAGQHFSAYPSAPSLKNLQTAQGIRGTATYTVTYLFNDSGSVTLPAIHLPWYQPSTQRIESARLPEHTFSVVGTPNEHPSPAQPVSPSPHAKQVLTFPTRTVVLVSIILILMCIIAALVCLKWPKKEPSRVRANLKVKGEDCKTVRRQLRNACLDNDAKAAHDQLLAWAKARWPEHQVMNLSQVTTLCQNAELTKEIEILMAAIYSAHAEKKWIGKRLWRAVEKFKPAASTKKRSSTKLPNLNPNDHSKDRLRGNDSI